MVKFIDTGVGLSVLSSVNNPNCNQSSINTRLKKLYMQKSKRCFFCQRVVLDGLPIGTDNLATIDHFYPIFDIRRGLLTERANTNLCCYACNKAKMKTENESLKQLQYAGVGFCEPHLINILRIAINAEKNKQPPRMSKTKHEVVLFKDTNQIIYTTFDNTTGSLSPIYWDGTWGLYSEVKDEGDYIVLYRAGKKPIHLPVTDVEGVVFSKHGFSICITPNTETGKIDFNAKLNPRKR